MKDCIKLTSMAKLLPALVVLLTVNNGVVEAIYTMNQTCLYYPQGYIANPDDCQAWGYCSGGSLKVTGKCGKGFLYDSSKGICNYASNVQCGTTAADICANLPDMGFVAVPNNCNEYCYCNKQKIVECNPCPSNQLYNPKDEQCEYDYACPIDSVCRLVPNNAFVGSPKICGQFIRCLDGSGTAQACSNSYYFNTLTGNCQPSNPCVAGNTPSESSPSTYPPNADECKIYNTETGGTQYFADGNTCYGYYSCSSATGTGTWRSCPFATQFDANTKQCVTPYSFACTKNRCGNINLPFMTVPNTNCKRYYVCNNNQQSATSYECPANFPYFDEVNQGCVEKPPNYPICAAA
ncbi:peritrophin-44 [Eurosta solidaginis]|uniref:peritrophin-44 n=1 Tax=Eurosta solidaginis TaxID=178769 RepID=UPI0035310330